MPLVLQISIIAIAYLCRKYDNITSVCCDVLRLAGNGDRVFDVQGGGIGRQLVAGGRPEDAAELVAVQADDWRNQQRIAVVASKVDDVPSDGVRELCDVLPGRSAVSAHLPLAFNSSLPWIECISCKIGIHVGAIGVVLWMLGDIHGAFYGQCCRL